MFNISLEIRSVESGFGSTGPYIRLKGLLRNGKPQLVSMFDEPAKKLIAEFSKVLPVGSEVSDLRLIVHIKGQWVEGKPYIDPNTGKQRTSRYFRGEESEIAQGRALQLERVKIDAYRAYAAANDTLKEAMASGTENQAMVKQALKSLLEFAAKTSGIDPDFNFIDALSDENPIEHDNGAEHLEAAPEVQETYVESNPEADALLRYQEQDRNIGLDPDIDAPAVEQTPVVEADPDEAALLTDVSEDTNLVAQPADPVNDEVASGLASDMVDPLALDDAADQPQFETEEPEQASAPVSDPEPASASSMPSRPAMTAPPLSRPPMMRPRPPMAAPAPRR